MKLGTKVSVFHPTNPFTGVICQVVKWKGTIFNPKKGGSEYIVKADDDGKLHTCPLNIITKI